MNPVVLVSPEWRRLSSPSARLAGVRCEIVDDELRPPCGAGRQRKREVGRHGDQCRGFSRWVRPLAHRFAGLERRNGSAKVCEAFLWPVSAAAQRCMRCGDIHDCRNPSDR